MEKIIRVGLPGMPMVGFFNDLDEVAETPKWQAAWYWAMHPHTPMPDLPNIFKRKIRKVIK